MTTVDLLHYLNNQIPPQRYKLDLMRMNLEEQFKNIIPDYFSRKSKVGQLVMESEEYRLSRVARVALRQYWEDPQVSGENKLLASLLEKKISLIPDEDREKLLLALQSAAIPDNSKLHQLYGLISNLRPGTIVFSTDNYELVGKVYKCDKKKNPLIDLVKLSEKYAEISIEDLQKVTRNKCVRRDLDALINEGLLVWQPLTEVRAIPRLTDYHDGSIKVSLGAFVPRDNYTK